MTVTKYRMITEEIGLKNKTYKSYWDSIAEEKKINSDSEDISENYEYNERYSLKTEEDEEAVKRALQISLLEEENKVAKMKDLRDSLSKELE